MSDEKLSITLSPIGAFHLNAYLSGLRINEVKSPEQLSAIAEALDSLGELIQQARDLQKRQELTEVND